MLINKRKSGLTTQDEQGNEKQVASKGSKLHQSLSVIKVQEQLIKNSGMNQKLPAMSPDMKNAKTYAVKEKEPENEEKTQRRGYRM